MNLSLDDLEQLLRLARLALERAEMESLRNELLDRLQMMVPLEHVIGEKRGLACDDRSAAHLRPDYVRPSLARIDALSNAPSELDGFFAVPRVIEG